MSTLEPLDQQLIQQIEQQLVQKIEQQLDQPADQQACTHIQTLWSGYGAIKRVHLNDEILSSVIVKHVQLPDNIAHPRGWHSKRSHQRKIRSYQVESAWYQDLAERCDEHCRVPRCFKVSASEGEFLMILEDLDAAGFAVRHDSLSPKQMQVCLDWLAHFHATFMRDAFIGDTQDTSTEGEYSRLWPVGTYWHLATRPDELEALAHQSLKTAAKAIDQALSSARYQSLVHGDAKLANFCFSEDGKSVAAVDFQYVGGGCGMKDLAYFIGSCLYEDDCERYQDELLDYYFEALISALKSKQPALDGAAIEQEWRALFSYAWADFHRFIKGWSPGHWKINAYSERVTRKVLAELSGSSPESDL